MTRKNPSAVALGRLGGRVGGKMKSAAKCAAARANGKLGGRPRKKVSDSQPASAHSGSAYPQTAHGEKQACKRGKCFLFPAA